MGITPLQRYSLVPDFYLRLIPALVSSGVPPFTLAHHTLLLNLWHGCFRKELVPVTRLVVP